MRIWQFWWRTLVYHPPFFIELLMTGLAFLFLVIWGIMKSDWQYLVLSSSYAMGAAMSMWVRESMTPSPQPRMTYLIAALLLFYGLYCFTELTPYLSMSH